MKCLVRLGVLTSLLLGASAWADEEAPACKTAEAFVPPSVPWIGQLIYKTKYKIRDGRAVSVDVSPYRGADRASNRAISKAMETFITDSYRCEGPDKAVEEYRVVNLTHDTSAVTDLLPEMLERKAAWQAEKAAAKQAGMPAPKAPAQVLCPQFGLPRMPNVSGGGMFVMQALIEVRNSTIGLVEVKLSQGSPDPAVNQLFIDEITRTIRDSYRCEGSHAIEQDFVFKIS